MPFFGLKAVFRVAGVDCSGSTPGPSFLQSPLGGRGGPALGGGSLTPLYHPPLLSCTFGLQSDGLFGAASERPLAAHVRSVQTGTSGWKPQAAPNKERSGLKKQ